VPRLYLVTVALALAPQARPDPPRLPVEVFAIVDHQVDTAMARGLTKWLIGSFYRDTSLLVIDRSGKARPRGPQAVYAVATDLERTKDRALRLTIRVVDVRAVYLVAVASVTGSADSLQRALPTMADGLGDRLRLLYAIRQPDRPPPRWQVPTDALRAYSLALLYLSRGDSAGAKGSLREALRRAPKYTDACEALKRLDGGISCGR
jgi:hypothetical protein